MKKHTSKLLAMLALAGFYGTSQSQVRSHKSEIKQLEKQRAEIEAERREAKERLKELGAEGDLSYGNWTSAEEGIRNFNWETKTPDLIQEREAEEARMREAANEMARIDKAIRKEKALERRERGIELV